MRRYLKSFNFKLILFNSELLIKTMSTIFYSIVAFSIAYLINTMLEYKLFSVPKPIFNIKKKESHIKVNTYLINKLFVYKTEKRKEKILLSSNDIKLKGIVWIGNEKLALVEIKNKGKKLLKEGEIIDNAKIIKIGNFYIDIKDNEGIKRIYIDIKGSMKRNSKNVSLNRISKSLNLKGVNNSLVVRLMKNTIIRPYREDGRRGLLIERVSDNTILEMLGLEEGDIILSVNGNPAVSVDAVANKVISAFNNNKPIEVVILRNGKEEKLIYNENIFKMFK